MARSSAALLLLVLLSCCGQPIGNVKVYFLEPEQGLVRLQTNEVLAFSNARGYLCESRKDFEDTVACVGANVKVWFLEPKVGLVRKQAKEQRTFQESRGYLCVSNAQMKQILERCVPKT